MSSLRKTLRPGNPPIRYDGPSEEDRNNRDKTDVFGGTFWCSGVGIGHF